MAKLIYAAITSLDLYTNDADGRFDWARPDEELHAFVNEMERPIGTYLYGRRMYETMAVWGDPDFVEGLSPVSLDYAGIWQAADKVVYSRTLEAVSTARTRIERELDPDAVRALKAQAQADITVGGAGLAGEALRAGLVDECHLFLNPIVVGGGTRALPDDVLVRLELIAEHRFASGVVHVGYRVA
jgi:dihydrofolate reductase